MRPTLPAGTTIRGYRIEGILGRGGMGVVYEATQLSLRRVVALKMLPAEIGSDPGIQERFRREALMQAAIDHPHIVDVYDAGSTEAGLYISMRLIRGETLKSRISAGPFPPDRVLALLGPVAEALDAAHAAGLVHRDVKPQNILLDAHDCAYLSDFGVANAVGQTTLTLDGGLVGTPHYMAPEQAMGDEATADSDVYSLATVVYECLTGVVPFRASSPVAVVRQQAWRPAPRPTTLRPDLPRELDDVFGRALAKRPSDRPASGTELMDEVARALGQSPRALATTWVPPAARAPRPAGRRSAGRPRRRLFIALAGATVLAAAALVFALGLDGDPPENPTPTALSVKLERPTVTRMTRGEFLRDRNIPTADIAAPVLREQGIAIEANLDVRGYRKRLPVTCAIRDLTTGRTIGDVRALETEDVDALTSTIPCWIPFVPQQGHRYRATVRVWPSDDAAAPLATAVSTYQPR